jgi:hypothetical protein
MYNTSSIAANGPEVILAGARLRAQAHSRAVPGDWLPARQIAGVTRASPSP